MKSLMEPADRIRYKDQNRLARIALPDALPFFFKPAIWPYGIQPLLGDIPNKQHVAKEVTNGSNIPAVCILVCLG